LTAFLFFLFYSSSCCFLVLPWPRLHTHTFPQGQFREKSTTPQGLLSHVLLLPRLFQATQGTYSLSLPPPPHRRTQLREKQEGDILSILKSTTPSTLTCTYP
jgi:hypothetical protein